MAGDSHFDELCTAAERRALIVLLEAEGSGAKSHLSRVKVSDPRATDDDGLLVSVRIGPKGLETAAAAAMRLLRRHERRAA